MDDEIRKLLSKSESKVLQTHLTEEEKKAIREAIMIDEILETASANEIKLNNAIAIKIISNYISESKKTLYGERKSSPTNITMAVSNMSKSLNRKECDEIFFKAYKKAKSKALQSGKELVVLTKRGGNKNNKFELGYYNPNLFMKEGIEVNLQSGYIYIENSNIISKKNAMKEFVDKVLYGKVDGIELDSDTVTKYRRELAQCEKAREYIQCFREEAKVNLKIGVLSLCEEAVRIYDKLNIDDNVKTKEFKFEIMSNPCDVEGMFTSEELRILLEYGYFDDIVGIKTIADGESVFVPTLLSHFKKSIEEFGVVCENPKSNIFILKVNAFAKAVLKASDEIRAQKDSSGKKGKK